MDLASEARDHAVPTGNRRESFALTPAPWSPGRMSAPSITRWTGSLHSSRTRSPLSAARRGWHRKERLSRSRRCRCPSASRAPLADAAPRGEHRPDDDRRRRGESCGALAARGRRACAARLRRVRGVELPAAPPGAARTRHGRAGRRVQPRARRPPRAERAAGGEHAALHLHRPRLRLPSAAVRAESVRLPRLPHRYGHARRRAQRARGPARRLGGGPRRADGDAERGRAALPCVRCAGGSTTRSRSRFARTTRSAASR